MQSPCSELMHYCQAMAVDSEQCSCSLCCSTLRTGAAPTLQAAEDRLRSDEAATKRKAEEAERKAEADRKAAADKAEDQQKAEAERQAEADRKAAADKGAAEKAEHEAEQKRKAEQEAEQNRKDEQEAEQKQKAEAEAAANATKQRLEAEEYDSNSRWHMYLHICTDKPSPGLAALHWWQKLGIHSFDSNTAYT